MDVKVSSLMRIVVLFFMFVSLIESRRLSVFPRVGKSLVYSDNQQNPGFDGNSLERTMEMSVFPRIGRAHLTEDDFQQYLRNNGMISGMKPVRMTKFLRVGRSLDSSLNDVIQTNNLEAILKHGIIPPNCPCILENDDGSEDGSNNTDQDDGKISVAPVYSRPV
ncbi:uncharacterized protein [Leptinotarsa decemlineata]|uniref:uncharacterized protein n=1 Tax=Leptinotarsa decemlineata TaxID=7539 RepID=UPI003D30B715